MTLDELIQNLQSLRDDRSGKLPVIADLGEGQHYVVLDAEGPYFLTPKQEYVFLSVDLNSVG